MEVKDVCVLVSVLHPLPNFGDDENSPGIHKWSHYVYVDDIDRSNQFHCVLIDH